MAIEKKWTRQGPVAFAQDGTESGLITVSSVECFKVKQIVSVKSNTQPTKRLQIKRIPSLTQIIVGPLTDNKNRKIDSLSVREDLSAYTVLDGATIQAEEQSKVTIPEKDIIQAVYEFEPTVAIRTIGVDRLGDPWSETNPLPVEGTISVQNGELPNKGKIQNIPVSNANTEFAINLPNNTKRYLIRVRNNAAKGRIAMNPTETNSNWWGLTRGTIFDSRSLNLPINSTIYMQTDKNNVVVEVISWIVE